jgi:hypothetical protein
VQRPFRFQSLSICRVKLVVVVSALVAGLSACGPSAADRAAEERARAEVAALEAEKAKARAEADAAREAARLADLWTYTDTTVGQARQRAAQIRSTNDVDTDGTGGRSVLLVFRDHTEWGRSSYLVLTAGDFACRPTCSVSIALDGAPPKPMKAHRPNTDAAIALFIDDERALWRALRDVKTLSIEFPVRAGGTRAATFDVAGLDRSKLPGWD